MAVNGNNITLSEKATAATGVECDAIQELYSAEGDANPVVALTSSAYPQVQDNSGPKITATKVEGNVIDANQNAVTEWPDITTTNNLSILEVSGILILQTASKKNM